jgi:phosphoribosylformylglycinamidine cyclo-ligase
VATKRQLTYRDAGVDIARADRLIDTIRRLAATTTRPEVLSGVGPFAAAVSIPRSIRKPVLLSSADGVGTKLAVAKTLERHDTIGIDLVAMNVNDLITAGAQPLFFLDYLGVGNLASIDAAAIISGIAEGCRQSKMSLVGGETAEMPGFYKDGDYDLAGFCVGVAEKRNLVDGKSVRPNDVLIGLPSDGLHSNGYSLARKALNASSRRVLNSSPPELDGTIGDELMKPTRIYVRPVLAALKEFRVKAMAHITGGGLPGNVVRMLPKGMGAVINRGALPELPIFDLIRQRGDISRSEMDKTFNCGVGFVMIVPARDAEALCSFLRRRKIAARPIGEVTKGPRRVRYSRALR